MNDTLERGDELMRIERFAGEDPEAAAEAFELLAPKIRAVVVRLLAGSVLRSVDREDVAEAVLQRLWKKRKEFEARSIPSWWRYVAVTARRCAADHWRPETPAEIADHAVEQGIDLLPIDAARLYEAADELWLRVESTLSRRERNCRLFAAQLYVLEGCSREEAAERANCQPDVLDHCLRSESVLLRLGFFHLYESNERLACHLLSIKDGSAGLDRLASQARACQGQPPAGWTWTEVLIVILRIRNGLTENKIAQVLDLDVEEVECVARACVRRFPYMAKARKLKKRLRARGLATRSLSSIDLWRRLAFQYFAADALPHRQILERTSEPAEVAGYGLNAGILNAWLSNRRILDQLVAYLRKEDCSA